MNQRSYFPAKIVKGLGSRVDVVLAKLRGNQDPVANPILLKRLSSYASIVIGKPVECRWGAEHHTDLQDTIVLNPNDPEKASPSDRKIVINAALEHEVRGHWHYTPRKVFESVCAMSTGTATEAKDTVWQDPKRASRVYAIQPLFNILEDGRVETRMRWEQSEAYQIIAAATMVRPRWTRPDAYPPAGKAYATLLRKSGKRSLSTCITCGENQAVEGLPCQMCFTEQYRWEQITGMLLLAAVPPHTPPTDVVESEVLQAFEECIPLVVRSLRGTAQQTFESAKELLKILIEKKMVPRVPHTKHLQVSDATGHAAARDSAMSTQTAQSAGLTEEESKKGRSSTRDGRGRSPASAQEDGGANHAQDKRDGIQRSPTSSAGDSKDSAGGQFQDNAGGSGTSKDSAQDHLPQNGKTDSRASTNPTKNQAPQNGKGASGAKSSDQVGVKRHLGSSEMQSAMAQLDELARNDLADHDWGVELNLDYWRRQAQAELDDAEAQQRADAARILIAGVNGLGAGPGIDVTLRRTQARKDVYRLLRQRNLERGKRFAREIQDLMNTVMRPQRFQRTGRLDRKQLVNAVARNKQTVFKRSKPHQQLDLAVSISVDISGSMNAFNQAINLISPLLDGRGMPVQLADAVATCVIGLEQLEVASEVRAFGSYQWLAKGFYDQNNDGLGGLPGEDNGGTDMTPAIEYSRFALLGREESEKLMVVMTDGCPSNPSSAAEQVRLARLQGIRVLGLLFANDAERRDATDPAMARLFGPSGYTVIHSLDEFPREVGRAIKEMIHRRALASTTS